MKRAAKHGRDENKRDEGWGGSHGWLRLKQGGDPLGPPHPLYPPNSGGRIPA